METVFRVSKCAEGDKVNFATCSLEDDAHSWWNSFAQSVGEEAAYQLTWENLKGMLTAKYCSIDKLQKLDEEFWHLKVQDGDIDAYTTRFQQLATLRPGMVSTEADKVRKYLLGLPEPVRGNVASSNKTTIEGAIQLAHDLMAMNEISEPPTSSSTQNKRKWSDNHNQPNKEPDTTETYNYQYQSPTKRLEAPKAYVARPEGSSGYGGYLPHCSNCKHHHRGPCIAPCARCNIRGHLVQDCKFPTTPANPNASRVCFVCGKSGHFMRNCPERQY